MKEIFFILIILSPTGVRYANYEVVDLPPHLQTLEHCNEYVKGVVKGMKHKDRIAVAFCSDQKHVSTIKTTLYESEAGK